MANDARVDIILALKAQLQGFDGSAAAIGRLKQDVHNAARAMDTDTDRFADKLKKKFSPANIGMSILSGFGLGSGFAAINLALDKVTQAYQEHQQRLKEIDERWTSIIAKSKAYWLGQQSPAAQIAELQVDLAALVKQRDDLVSSRSFKSQIVGPGFIKDVESETTFGSSTDWEKYSKLTEQITETARALEQAEQKLAAANKKSVTDAKASAKEISSAAAEAAKEQEQARQKIAGALAEQDRQLATLAERYRQLIDPAREYAQQQDEINMLLRGGKISADEAAAALERVARAAADAEEARVDAALKKFFGPLDEASEEAFKKIAADAEEAERVVERMGWAFSSAFEDAILNGEKFSEVLRGLARDLAQIAIRTAITEPLGLKVGGFIKDVLKLGGGGTFVTSGPTNLTVGDNPGGVELVSVYPLSGVGQSSLNGRSLAMAGGGTALAGLGGDTFNFSYSFAGGVSKQEVLGLLPTLVEASKAAVLDAKRRGRGGF